MYRILELNPQLQNFAWDIDYRMELYRNAVIAEIFCCDEVTCC